MKLTKHQKDIVNKILTEEVYDIPSYLRIFEKGHIRRYDIPTLRQKFEEDEQGKTYKVMKEGHSTSKPAVHEMKRADYLPPIVLTTQFPRTKESISDDEWEYRIAVLDENISPQTEEYNEQTFKFDFQHEGVFVADDFEDIKDFISLWTYLLRESFVLEVDKALEPSDISVCYQTIPITTKNEKTKGQYSKFENIADGFVPITGICSPFQHDILNEPPKRHISSYLTLTWQLNKDHLLICKEFIGKKIIPNSDLKIYLAHKYKTVNEVSQEHSVWLAWIAISLSVVSILIGNIWPLFQQDEETIILNKIEGNIVEISKILSNPEPTVNWENYYSEIRYYLDEINNSLNTKQLNDDAETIEDIIVEIETIQNILSERLPQTEPSP